MDASQECFNAIHTVANGLYVWRVFRLNKMSSHLGTSISCDNICTLESSQVSQRVDSVLKNIFMPSYEIR